ncbi:hypothetical protein CCYS_04525 [Corynebacterium cystitidis DSM 20524]|uniref:Uncharacterized protein n=1 Tax=Corynebacterium cystitidis DSM 20524 TaxID=1121357 RepID=A0A1H9WE89_9CORY|nr:hypothetical protein CCYS_04525 [Corynebacterium cystitidis DSM 20524]SES32099.1 hypothetical protein SAMN05661109_02692 [Corynebacterium cystitidis DSM 20524]SNV82798.1 Uncharacterised protein [Corynebacterium cystitidis]
MKSPNPTKNKQPAKKPLVVHKKRITKNTPTPNPTKGTKKGVSTKNKQTTKRFIYQSNAHQHAHLLPAPKKQTTTNLRTIHGDRHTPTQFATLITTHKNKPTRHNKQQTTQAPQGTHQHTNKKYIGTLSSSHTTHACSPPDRSSVTLLNSGFRTYPKNLTSVKLAGIQFFHTTC